MQSATQKKTLNKKTGIFGSIPNLWTQQCQCRLRLVEPEAHLHVAVQGYGGAQCGVRLLSLAGGGIQRAEPPMAVGDERTHAERLGQGQGLQVVGFGPLAWR